MTLEESIRTVLDQAMRFRSRGFKPSAVRMGFYNRCHLLKESDGFSKGLTLTKDGEAFCGLAVFVYDDWGDPVVLGEPE